MSYYPYIEYIYGHLCICGALAFLTSKSTHWQTVSNRSRYLCLPVYLSRKAYIFRWYRILESHAKKSVIQTIRVIDISHRPYRLLYNCFVDQNLAVQYSFAKVHILLHIQAIPTHETNKSMRADTIHDSDQRNGDNDSLFGSPPSSPVRGRSPALALPSGEYCTQNVGTIALPGSHNFIELPVNTPALSLSGFSHYEPSQRPPAANTSRPQVESQVRTLPTRSNSSQSIRGGNKKRSSRENSSAPRLPPPPIHLPDPNVPPPPNFLRNQQALLGIAGLIGGVNPANLSVPRHTRGSNASNPIVVEDVLNPPPLGRQDRCSDIDPSMLTPPSNEEIVASLIREKNIFPVLESILKLIASNARSTTPKGHDNRDGSHRPVTKRRKVDGVPAGATDWDVPFPFMDGEGPQADWKKMRGEQLISQLVSLIKSAARKASSRTHQRQHMQPRRYQQPPRQQQQLGSVKQQDSEPKIMGHYRPVTATYGQPGAQIPEALADQSNTSGSNAQASPSPYEEPPAFQPFPSPSNAGTRFPTPFDEMFSSLLAGSLVPSSGGPGDDGQSTSGWSGGTDTPSEISTPDINQNAFDNWLSILNAFPDPGLNSEQPSTSYDGYDIDSLVSSLSTDFPMQNNSSHIIHDNIYSAGDSTTSSTNMNPDFAIDPVLLAMSTSGEPSPLNFDALPSQPTLAISPIESASSTAEPLTPQVEISTLEPELFTGEQGMSIEAAQDLFVAQMVGNQDPMMAASTLLQFASTSMPSPSSNPATYVTASSAVDHAPTTGSSSLHEAAPRPTYDFFQRPVLHRRSSDVSTERQTVPPPTRTFQITPALLRSMPIANQQDILTRARERRRQLVGEIDRAKVELWETTIEQGVLAQFVKEKL